jgi:hypothetical protein
VVYRDVTRQAKGLYRLKHVGALGSGLAYLSGYNSGWFCHTDGLSVSFYEESWAEIRDTMLEMFNHFHDGNLNLSRLNYDLISLIPKMKEANNIKQYRPICLLNVDYNLLTKVLTMRLNPLAEKIVSATQTDFIPWRYILDGVVILREVLHELRVRKQSGVILKLDFEKAYDKVNWNFMIEVLERKRFPEKWIAWIKQIIEGAEWV